MSYNTAQLVTFNVNTADSVGATADNIDVYNIIIPAGREIEIHSIHAFVRAAAGAGDFYEICNDSDTVLAKVAVSATGAVSSTLDGTTASTFPIRVASQSATALSTIKIRTDGANDTSTDVTVQMKISGL